MQPSVLYGAYISPWSLDRQCIVSTLCTRPHKTTTMLNANFQGLLSAVQPSSHPLTQLPLIIGLPCETLSRVFPGKLFLFLFFKQRTPRSRTQGTSDMHKHCLIRVPIYTPGLRGAEGRIFCSEKSDGPGTIQTRDPSIHSPESYHRH